MNGSFIVSQLNSTASFAAGIKKPIVEETVNKADRAENDSFSEENAAARPAMHPADKGPLHSLRAGHGALEYFVVPGSLDVDCKPASFAACCPGS